MSVLTNSVLRFLNGCKNVSILVFFVKCLLKRTQLFVYHKVQSLGLNDHCVLGVKSNYDLSVLMFYVSALTGDLICLL